VDALVIHILVTNRRSALLWEDQLMNNDNVAAVRNAYAVAERKDLEGWINLFTPDGVFVDNSVGATYRGRALADPVRNYGTAFSNMHRELYRIYVDGNVVVVQGPAGHPRWPAAASLRRAACHG
jgi:ketosteroid isomerase-like protein